MERDRSAIAQTDPFALFEEWFQQARESEPNDPNAMALATATPEGAPSVRMVLLKDRSPDGFTFYTNAQSRKGEEIRANMQAALLFHWKSLRRQIRIEGPLSEVSAEEADAYFQSRDRAARIGAWASKQSWPMEGRFELEKKAAKFPAKFNVGPVPRPDFWSGYRILPEMIEFWTQRKFRLHDRLVYHRADDGWTTERLFP